MSADEKIAEIREWLRMHGDYGVRLELHDLYGTIRITVTHLGRELYTDIGATLDRRLANARAFLNRHAGGTP